MQAIEWHLLGHSTQALLEVLRSLKRTPISVLVSTSPSRKDDSLKLDVIPESIIRSKLIEDYDRHLVIVTEEKGEYNFQEINKAELVAFSDPTDRSKQLKLFLENLMTSDKIDPNITLQEIENEINIVECWEKMYDSPARLSGACCSFTMVKRGEILFSIILNYITQEIVIACEDFIGSKATSQINLTNGQYNFKDFNDIRFSFHSQNNETYVTYLGKPIYERCLSRTNFIPSNYKAIEKEPGGPLRILYMSDINDLPVEFILSNGEKIGEWLGWLAFCKHSKELVVFSIFPESDFSQKDDILMYPSPPYSILEILNGKLKLNFNKLMYFSNPSRYREFIFVTHKNNHHLQAIVDAAKSRALIYTS